MKSEWQELNRLYPYLFLWVVPTLDFPSILLFFATYSVEIQFSTVSLLQSCSFWRVFRNFRLPCLHLWNSTNQLLPQPEFLKRIEAATFYSCANEKVQTCNHLLFRPDLWQIAPRISRRSDVPAWLEVQRAIWGLFRPYETKRLILWQLEFFQKTKLSDGWLCCGQNCILG